MKSEIGDDNGMFFSEEEMNSPVVNMNIKDDRYNGPILACPIKTSCGTIVTNGDVILLGHPTDTSFWEIPKGLCDPDEPFVQAAMRELKEETGIIANFLHDFGVRKYLPHKDLHVSCLRFDHALPDIHLIRCTSMFYNQLRDCDTVELDAWQWVYWADVPKMVLPKMWEAIKVFQYCIWCVKPQVIRIQQ